MEPARSNRASRAGSPRRSRLERAPPRRATLVADGSVATRSCGSDSLDRRGHDRLALLVFDDPKLLRIENAYTLREVTHGLLTAVTDAEPPTLEFLEQRANEVIGAFVAPLWRINDISARMVAQAFYRCLLLERTTIGVALQKARVEASRAWAKRRGDYGLGDLSWAGMVLYGNPVERIVNNSCD